MFHFRTSCAILGGMSDYPKYFTKGDVTKVAHSARDEVKLKFAGYTQAAFRLEATTEEPPAGHTELAGRLLPRNDMVLRALETGTPLTDVTDEN